MNEYLNELSKDADVLAFELDYEKKYGIRDAGRDGRIAELEKEYKEAKESYLVAYYESIF